MMKKILFLDHTLELSGGERSLLDIMRGLKSDYALFLITPGKSSFKKKAEEMRIKEHILPLESFV